MVDQTDFTEYDGPAGTLRAVFSPTPSPVARAVGQVEQFLGAVVACLLSVAIILSCLAVAWAVAHPRTMEPLEVIKPALAYPLTGVLFVAESISAMFIFRTLQNQRPLPLLAVVDRQIVFPKFLRPLVAGWWATHFALVAWAGHRLLPQFGIVPDPTPSQLWATRIVEVLFLIGLSFSSNLYLLLSAAAISNAGRMINLVYRFRLVFDLILSLIVFAIPSSKPHE